MSRSEVLEFVDRRPFRAQRDKTPKPGVNPGHCSLDIYRRSRREICAPKGLEDSAQGFNQVSTLGTDHPERCALKGRMTRSAWDSATRKEPSRRVRCDSRRCAHRLDDWSDENSNVKTYEIYVALFLAVLNPDIRERLWQLNVSDSQLPLGSDSITEVRIQSTTRRLIEYPAIQQSLFLTSTPPK
jgi:hypothetical protein